MAVEDLSIERPGLYIVSTPIGNLGDFSARALAVLQGVDRILSEDTRHSGRLFERFGITTAVSAYHEHNERRVVEGIVSRMQDTDEAYALVCDAGTPLISDPGFILVRAAAAAGIPVLSVPGACAVTAALSISGLPTDRFIFEGFLPAQAGARDQRLKEVANERRTVVFYEAPHRVMKALEGMRSVFGVAREVVVARELTKRFETVYRGRLDDVIQQLRADANASRGEFVILIAGSEVADDALELERVLDVVLPATDHKTAVRIAAALTGCGRNEVYRRVLARNEAAKGVEK